MILALLWLGCGGGAPADLAAQAEALAAFRQAQASLAAGDEAAAMGFLEQASGRRGGDPLLGAWRAHVLSTSDLEGAVGVLDGVLAARPDFALARYNRAAYLARLGRLDEAGPDLRRALDDGAAEPNAARVDADFAPHLAHEAFGFLPPEELQVEWGPLPARVFIGSELTVTLTTGHEATPVALGHVKGPVDLVGSLESHQGDRTTLSWTFVVEGARPIVVGPIDLRAGGATTVAGPREVEGVGPPGAEPSEARRIEVRSASEVAAFVPVGSALRRGGTVWVKALVTQMVTVTPSLPPLRRHEFRDGGQPQWVAWEYPAEIAGVRIKGSDGVTFDGPPTGESVDPQR